MSDQPPDAGTTGGADPLSNGPGSEGTAQILVGVSFAGQFRAREFLLASQRLAAQGDLVLEDAVIVTKDAQGRTSVHETRDLQTGRTALSGAVWTSLIGLLLGGPVGWIAGGAIGAGAGAVTARMVDLGISDEWVRWFRDAVDAGTTTVALLVTHVDHDALVAEVSRFRGGELVYSNLPHDVLERLTEALGDD